MLSLEVQYSTLQQIPLHFSLILFKFFEIQNLIDIYVISTKWRSKGCWFTMYCPVCAVPHIKPKNETIRTEYIHNFDNLRHAHRCIVEIPNSISHRMFEKDPSLTAATEPFHSNTTSPTFSCDTNFMDFKTIYATTSMVATEIYVSCLWHRQQHQPATSQQQSVPFSVAIIFI